MDQLIEETVTGPIASFTDGANNIPAKEIICHINPTETGTGEKSPSNPYVIGGFTGINVIHAGVNLWDEQWACEKKDISTTTGNLIPSSSAYYFRSLNYIPVTPNTTIYNYNIAVSGNYRFFFYDQNKDYLSYISKPSNATVSIPNNAYYMLFRFRATAQTIYENNISINYPSTDTDYHAYNGQTHHVPFGQTVYGGELVLQEGQNDKLIPWEYIASYNGEVINEPWVSSMDAYSAGTTPTTGAFVCYPATLPTEITLPTKTVIPTLLGANNIYHDCNGDTDVTYRANGALYVQEHPITRGLMAARPTEQIQEQEEQQEEKEINKSEDNER